MPASRKAAHIGDFTTTARLIPIAALAVVIGAFAAYVAAALLKLIGFFTNIFFFQRVDTTLVSPEGHHLGPFVILVPLGEIIERQPVVAYNDEPLRVIVYRMADKGVTRLPVVSRADGTFVGMLALTDLLGARARILDAEQRRERVLGARLRLPLMFGGRSDSAA